MALTAGTRVGPYEVIALLGAGGMGEVYRAKDTRLDRTVAIKIVAEAVGSDAERRQRFEREARAIASLSHPHVCALHDVGSATSPESGAAVEYLVMEYLEGETLAARVARGPLTTAEIVRFGSEMAGALDAAHRQRIVHRDLKPANVMVTKSGVKLLDFGLARAVAPAAPSGAVLSTVTVGMTIPGTVLGTLPYMSPEQVEGREADARSDIFALGSVLYEMATGRRAFAADSPAGIASAILSSEPPPIATSASLDRLVRGCLRKDPDERWQSAQDVALQLREVEDRDRQSAAAPVAPSPALAPWIVAGVAAAAALAAVVVAWRMQSVAVPSRPFGSAPMSFAISLGPGDAYLSRNVERPSFALSPDGQTLAFAGGASGQPAPAVMVRRLSSESVTALPGTEGASSVFWSPDGKSIGFFAQGKLKRVDLAGGAPISICDVSQGIGLTGTWGDGQIVFGTVSGVELMRVPLSGGTASVVQQLHSAIGEQRMVWPSFLPDGRRFLYLSVRGPGEGVITIGATDGSPSREVLAIRSNAQYASPGHLLYGRDGVLLAQRFDPASGAVSGEPLPIADGVSQFMATGLTDFSASAAGSVVFHQGADTSRIVAFDRIGRESKEIRAAGPYVGLRLYDQGRGLYVDRRDPKTSLMDIWKLDLDRGSETRLTSEPAAALNPVLLSDGSLIFSTARGGPPTLLRRGPDGKEDRLNSDPLMQVDSDLSPDNRWIIYSQRTKPGPFNLVALQLSDKKAVPFQASAADESSGRFSPDGRYIAFVSNLGGRRDVYVAPFPGPGPARIVSTTGGVMPRWSRDAAELFYVAWDGSVFAVPIRTFPSLEIGQPRLLFTRGPRYRWGDYEPTADGRFIALDPVSFANVQPLHLVLNWAAASR